MTKPAVLIILFFFLFYSCKEEQNRKIKRGEMQYGDTLQLSLPEPVQTFFPLYNDDIYSHRLLCNIFEPLFDVVDSNNRIVPRVAEKYTWNNDNRVLTLFIRGGIKFSDDPCFQSNSRDLTAADVKFTLEMACSSSNLNQATNGLIGKIKGSEDFFNGKAKNITGIKVINTNTIELSLTGSYTNLPNLLSSSKYGICSKIAYDYYGKNILNHPVGSGPFYLKKNTTKDIFLDFNPDYWMFDSYGNRLPYLSTICYHVFNNAEAEIAAFKNQQLDYLFEVPTEKIKDIFSSLKDVKRKKPFPHRVIVIPGSRVSILVLNQNLPCFQDSRVRKAIDLIIDRDYLTTQLINGDGIPANKGIAPNSYYYNNKLIPARSFNVKLAQQLMQEAGYSKAKPFPEIHFYAAGNNQIQIKKYCTYVAEQLTRQLGIHVVLNLEDQEGRLNAIKQNKADIWKLGLNPDYPDPDAYFGLFYSKNPNNSSQNPLIPKINSEAYDLNYTKAIQEINETRKNYYFTNCDMILTSESWTIPLMYEDYIIIQNLRARGGLISNIGTIDLRKTYIKPL
jgi:ABC-type transport system substrate-binding protein